MTSETQPTGDGGGIERQRLQRLEELAMAATVAVILATFALVGTAHGREANPVMGAVLDLAGWPAFAAAKLVVTAGVFAVARRVVAMDRYGTTRAALAGAGTFTLLMVLNAGHDLVLLAEVWPVGLRWGTSLGYAGAVAGLGLGLVVRPDPRPLLSVSRGVTVRLSTPNLSAARKSLVAAMLVLAAVSGAVTFGPLPAADRASAAGSLIEDFEDGDANGWGLNGAWQLTSNSSRVIEGDYSIYHGSSNAGNPATYDLTDEQYDSFAYRANYEQFSDTRHQHILREGGGSSDLVAAPWIRPDGTIEFDTITDVQINEDTTYRFRYDFHYSNNTFTFTATNLDTGDTQSHTKSMKSSGVSSVGYVEYGSNYGPLYSVDYVTVNGQDIGQKVSGNVYKSDGSGLSSATVELLQSGSVVKSTTTNSSGGYKFTGVSDGDYTIRASGSGYQNASKSVTVSGSPRTVDLTLYESGTFEREFQLGEQASKTYPPSLAELQLYRFDRAIEFPLPGGTTFKAGPGDWNKVTTTEFNAYGTASARLENGEPYRVDVVATSGPRATRWESLGWRADTDGPDPFLITVQSSSATATATPTGTTTGTATSPTATPVETAGGGGSKRPGLNPPCDPFDQDDDGDLMSCPDGDGTNGPGPTVTYTESDGFGPRVAGECVLADGTSGVLVEYWDPSYETTSLTFNVSHANSSYAGEGDFDTPAGYGTWCVADSVTGNASDAAEGALSGNYTQNGTTFNYTDDLQQSALFGGPIGGGGGAGETTTGQRVVGIGLTAGVGYLLVRRFTEFRLSNAVAGALSRARSLVGGGS